MRLIHLAMAASALSALAACGSGTGAGNNVANEANIAVREGLGDPNTIISGDELEPVPEAQDDMIANQAGNANAPVAGNANAPASNNVAAPAPAAPPSSTP